MFSRIMFIALAVMVAGCSDPKAASEKNFKASIQKLLDAEYPKCYVVQTFPAVSHPYQTRELAKFKALVAAGLLSEKEEPHEVADGWQGKKKIVMRTVFDLTEEGKKFYKADAAKSISGETIGGICFGKATVQEITRFTEPSDMMGMRGSNVSVTYSVSDFPAWAKSPEILAAFSNIKADVESEKTPIKGDLVLVLTNKGWDAPPGLR
ncbi:MAG: hypothetical protein ABL915_04955 [Gallionella sp.]